MALADLGRNVRRYMKLQKLSIPQLAEKSGLGTATLSNILNEKASPNSSTLIKISTALGVSFPELLAETPKLRTDQHAMAIVGLTKNKQGHMLFICKNSWGKQWGMNGYCLMSKEDFLINTILVGVVGKN